MSTDSPDAGADRSWTPAQKGLLAAALVVAVIAAVLAVMALDPARTECERGTNPEAVDVDRPAEEALAEFVGANADQFPLDGWEVATTEGDRTTFTNDAGGGHEVVVERGAVRSFEACG